MSADENTLMRAVLEQMADAEFKLDYEKIAAATGAPTANAARVRWGRFKEKLIGKNAGAAAGSITTPSKPSGVTKRTPKTGSTRKSGAKKGKSVDGEAAAGEDNDNEPSTPSKPARKRGLTKAQKAANAAAEEADDMLLGGPVKEPKPDIQQKYNTSYGNATTPGNTSTEAAGNNHGDDEV